MLSTISAYSSFGKIKFDRKYSLCKSLFILLMVVINILLVELLCKSMYSVNFLQFLYLPDFYFFCISTVSAICKCNLKYLKSVTSFQKLN